MPSSSEPHFSPRHSERSQYFEQDEKQDSGDTSRNGRNRSTLSRESSLTDKNKRPVVTSDEENSPSQVASSQESSSTDKDKMPVVASEEENSSSQVPPPTGKKKQRFTNSRKFIGNGVAQSIKMCKRTAEELSLKTEKETKDLYAAFEKSFDKYIKKYEKNNCRSKLTDLTSGLKEQLKNNQAIELHDVACSLGPINDNDLKNVREYKEKIRLASYCIGQTLPSAQNQKERYKSLFLHATLGTTHSDPQKWGVWKIVLFTAMITLLGILLLMGVFSIAYAIIHIGTNVASTMNIWHLLQAGWNGMLPYRSWIPLSYGFFSSLTTGYLFGKTKIEKKISRLEKEIHPNEQSQNGTAHHLDQLKSLKLLDEAIDKIQDKLLQKDLRELYIYLNDAHAETTVKGIPFTQYLDSIIFTTTAFARSVVDHTQHPSPLTQKKRDLLFDAVMGASLAPRPNQTWLLTIITPWLPALLVMALFLVILTPAVLIGYISLNGILLASPIFSFISLLPYSETESTLSNKIKNYFIPNPIQKKVFSIEKTLSKLCQSSVMTSSSTATTFRNLSGSDQDLSTKNDRSVAPVKANPLHPQPKPASREQNKSYTYNPDAPSTKENSKRPGRNYF
jgi:hypothetical protein